MSDYRAEHIQVLEGIEPVRRRPGMFIGSTGVDGLHHLVIETVNNSVDEAIVGHAKNITVRLLKGGRVAVSDDGRGIPVDTHAKTKKSALETVLTTLHAGGKFSHKAYKVSGGLHGVGISVVNALSKKLKAVVHREGFEWTQEYERGLAKGPIERGKKVDDTGTTIIFEPDGQIFSELEFNRQRILDYLRHQAFLTPGLRINFFDERTENIFRYAFYFEAGLISFFRYMTLARKLITPPISYQHEADTSQVSIILGVTESMDSSEIAFTNNIQNPEGGTHLTGFRNALLKVCNEVGGELKVFKNGVSLTSEDVRNGLMAIISLRIPEPQFEGQTKMKLGNPEVRGFVESGLTQFLREYFGKNPQVAKAMLQRFLINYDVRQAAKSARDSVLKKRLSANLTLSGKLADCSNREVEKRELFIVEGDSAGGSAKQGRDKNFQAILPLRGKILNVEKASLEKMFQSEVVKDLIIALGAGVGKEFNLGGLRYRKIIIASDADSDGLHIRTLLLTLFYRYFKAVIEGGFVFIAQPPLYKITAGKEIQYAYNDRERDVLLKKIKQKNVDVQRYKGLGEMNPEELWETTLNPEQRLLKLVTIENAEKADQMFNVLMGSEVEPRKRFIETYAREVQNLDI